MTSDFSKKVMWISLHDRHVIVDNFVETGDFSNFNELWIKNFVWFSVKICKWEISK